VLDVCAAPGSKTTHVATKTRDLSFIVAGDLHGHRLRTVRESASKQGVENLGLVVHDAEAALPFPDNYFDRVLVDAPCTGTGTLRRNPEIRWRITDRDVSILSARQGRILRGAARVVRPGGRLVYSTCSVEPEENEKVTAGFLARERDFVQLPLTEPANLRSEGGHLRAWPHREGADGFFIAAFERNG
jgi:16S rRNA (cytosine967-C5)-methyltransferase